MNNKNIEEIIQELIDWNYGTYYKRYDDEEFTEILEEDTRKYGDKIIKLVAQNYTPNDQVQKKQEEAVRGFAKSLFLYDEVEQSYEINPNILNFYKMMEYVNLFLSKGKDK